MGQLLSKMQYGMCSYFDVLSSQKHFIGIQLVLVEEINNSDSKKYAILTTTDSFYRYKEAVKELISEILNENDEIDLIAGFRVKTPFSIFSLGSCQFRQRVHTRAFTGVERREKENEKD